VTDLDTPAAIKLARERLGLSQTRFGQLLGVKQETVSMWETGAAKPKMSLARMQEVLQGAVSGGVRPDLAVDPRSYALGVLTGIEGDARSTLEKIAEARRVLGATPDVGGLEYAAVAARPALRVAEAPLAKAAGGSRRRGRQR
jgi:putative transcriptional regulator